MKWDTKELVSTTGGYKVFKMTVRRKSVYHLEDEAGKLISAGNLHEIRASLEYHLNPNRINPVVAAFTK